MNSKSRLVLERFGLALLVGAWMGCTSPTSNGNSNGTGGRSGGNSGGTTGGGNTSGGATGGTTGGGNTSGGATGGTTGGGNTSGGATGGTTGGNATGGVSGGSTGGTTGTGGTTVVQKECVAKTTIVTPVFMDFENYNGTVTAANYATAFGGATVNTGNSYAGLYSYPEAKGGTVLPALAMVAGHSGNWAASESWSATMWGMGGGIWMGCADASAYKGISFWARGTSGTGSFSFMVAMQNTDLPDSTNSAGGGTCAGTSDTCKPAEMDKIPITTDWTQVQILWTDFTPGLSGTTQVVPNGDNITGMQWTVPLAFQADPTMPADAGVYVPVPDSLRIDIDDITFIQ